VEEEVVEEEELQEDFNDDYEEKSDKDTDDEYNPSGDEPSDDDDLTGAIDEDLLSPDKEGFEPELDDEGKPKKKKKSKKGKKPKKDKVILDEVADVEERAAKAKGKKGKGKLDNGEDDPDYRPTADDIKPEDALYEPGAKEVRDDVAMENAVTAVEEEDEEPAVESSATKPPISGKPALKAAKGENDPTYRVSRDVVQKEDLADVELEPAPEEVEEDAKGAKDANKKGKKTTGKGKRKLDETVEGGGEAAPSKPRGRGRPKRAKV
jgi:hypothetical protein